MKNVWRSPLISAVFCFLVGCGSSNDPSSIDFSGTYNGAGTLVNTGCTDPTINTTFQVGARIQLNQSGTNVSGTVASDFNFMGASFVGVDNLTGTVNTNQISGNLSGSLGVTQSEGTFTGQLNGNTLSLDFTNRDTVGETCTTVGQMTATK